MVTIYDIAKHCGVSPSTVSKAINNYASIPLATKQKIFDAMEELNYIPNTSAKYLSKGSSHIIGVLAYFGTEISPLMHPLFAEILDYSQKVMNENGYDLLFISRNVAGKNETFLKNSISRNVDGVILFGDLSHPEMVEVIESKIPCVAFDYYGMNIPSVVSNNYQAMFQLSEHLIFHGHKNIVFIHGEQNEVTMIRIKAFKDALKKHNIVFNEQMLFETKFTDRDRIARITEDIISRRRVPTAIMYSDDLGAIEGVKVLRSLGLNVPRDMSVTGFDGIPVAQLVSPTITTFKQNTALIGHQLACKLMREMRTKTTCHSAEEIMGELVIGQSTAHASDRDE